MRPIHIGNIETSYQQKVDNKAKEISQKRAELYKLESIAKKNPTRINNEKYNNAKEAYKLDASKIYKEALYPLKNRVGNYCCYCERKYPSHLAVEHKCPKDIKDNWNLILDWKNFLISCSTCNSKKNSKEYRCITKSNVGTILFPDQDDTYHIFLYNEKNNYSATLNADFINQPLYYLKARQTLRMLKLNECDDISDSATRCYERRAKAITAGILSQIIQRDGIQEIFKGLIESEVKEGCWSIWMRQFEHIPEIKEIILFAVPNTAVEYFIDNYWEHENYFCENHSTTEYLNRLISIIRSRIDYTNTHTNLSQIQKDGIINWTLRFVMNIKQQIQFTKDQLEQIESNVAELRGL